MSMFSSENILLKCLAKRCMYQSHSNMGKNVSFIDNLTCFLKHVGQDVSREDIVSGVKRALSCNQDCEQDSVKADICYELLGVRDGILSAPLDRVEALEQLSQLY